ncbi:TonB-dependent receptor domain-containing protein [Ideonella livida]|uniref:TonB-dependent receptor n=1 Tax=Ideonella livida TaxID=2707176 RepID=A0A7C9TGX6_9BURK|nr:TonB-dependent receptor [Ideonella livida]NDY90101.1 TonB-dependent receptor [Ideonella livida]
MFQRTKISVCALMALGAIASAPAAAQEVQRVEVTGSAIKRIAAETALPVQIITREQIDRTGATSTVDLVQRLGAVQGGTAESDSVGGSTLGFSGVSIHGVGETRTLVLLNGHRLSQFGGQTLTGFASAVDLNAIPLAAIERVEVLTDGASALYGSDAIAGVVNFITKRDSTVGDISVGVSNPKGGAKEKRFSISKGFGSLSQDGFNVLLAYSHDERTALKATQRDFAKTGNLLFSKDGKSYRLQNYSASSIPANVVNDRGELVNPYLMTTGSCPDSSFRVTSTYEDGGESYTDDFCGFDFVSTLEIYPERKRDAFMGSGTFAVGEHTIMADLLFSKTNQVSKIAPVPGGISIKAGTDLHNTYLLPLGITGDTTAYYRIADLGSRTNDDTAKFYDLSLSARGPLMGWDYEAGISTSKSKAEGTISGYPGALAVTALRKSGKLNPFVLPGQQTADGLAALSAANYQGYFDGGSAELTTLNARASRELFPMGGGKAGLAVGFSASKEKFQSKPSLFAQGLLSDPVAGTLCDPVNDPGACDQRFGDAAAAVPYSANRTSQGLFTELEFPFSKSFSVTTAARLDKYSDFGSAATGKTSFRFQPSREVLLRGSIGTGFHAPSVPQVKASPQSYGVTEDKYDCTPELAAIAASLGAECRPGLQQYDVIAGGNAKLKAEKSLQGTLGLRLEPAASLSMGADIWWVRIRDAFGQLDEKTLFGSPAKYSSAWSKQYDLSASKTYLALNQGNLNLGKEYYTGIDFDVEGRFDTGLGKLRSRVLATYMLKASTQDPVDLTYTDTVHYYRDGEVTFRWRGNWSNAIRMGDWEHTLTMNFRSGYHDETNTVEVLDSTGAVTGTEDISLKIKPYYSFDWQTRWDATKAISLTAGILNVFDKAPPLVLSAGGGQPAGYDDRYYDPRGRTWYVNFGYKF